MTPLPALVAFVAAAGLLTVTPGLDTVLVLRTATGEGRRAAVLAACGIAGGVLVWGAAVALGLGALMAAAPLAYAALTWMGAAYLVALGLGLLFRPRHSLAATGPVFPDGGFAPLRRGLVTNLLNPKVGVFYLSFLPPFVPAGWPAAPVLFGLAALHAAMGLLWLATLALGVERLRPWLLRGRVVAALDRLTGLVFLGFGLRVLLRRAA